MGGVAGGGAARHTPHSFDPHGGEIQVVHYPFGDFDRDCDVDVGDIMVVASRWNDPGSYNAAYDFDSDGDIDVADIMQVASVWGDTCEGLGGLGLALAVYPAESADILFNPQIATADVGVPFTMTIAIENVTDLGGFEFDLIFAPDVVTVTNIYLGDFLESSGNNVGELGPRNSGSGLLAFGAFSYGNYEGASGSGTLGVLELTLLTDARTTLYLEDVQLVASDAGVLPVHSVGEAHIGWTRVYLPLILRRYP